MLKLIFITIVVVLCLNQEALARTLSESQVRAELRRQGFPENQLNDWVCLVMAESSGRTHIIGPPNKDGTKDYGLFQINSGLWCSNTGSPGKGCNVKCQDVITDNITKASQCAKTIFRKQGFKAWVGWKNHCRK